jgi:RimJ/RimL family protein N-acetyltransferase
MTRYSHCCLRPDLEKTEEIDQYSVSMNLDLQTERLLLRPLADSDLNLALEMFTDEEITKYIGSVSTEEQIAEGMPDSVKRGGGGCIGVWCISHRATGEKLGSVFLLPLPIEENDTDWNLVVEDQLPDGDIEIGYILKVRLG